MTPIQQMRSLGVLTSGGDAPGMNAAVRAVVRTAMSRGADVYAIYDGYDGMVAGGDSIRKMTWDAVGGILQLGGTAIGSARCAEGAGRPLRTW
jgi:6-phosphofructokinase 1